MYVVHACVCVRMCGGCGDVESVHVCAGVCARRVYVLCVGGVCTPCVRVGECARRACV